MTQNAVATPTNAMPGWRRRTLLIVAAVIVVALAVGAVVTVVATRDSSTATRTASEVTPVAAQRRGPGCLEPSPRDGAYLVALIASSPNGQQIGASVSPRTRQLVSDATRLAASSGAPVSPPDAATLFGVLARLGPADFDAVIPLLPSEMQAQLAAIALSGAAIGNVGALLTCG